jgi:hypothetical protein
MDEIDEATISRIAQLSYERSENLATRYTPWAELNEASKERIHEVVRDMLAAMAEIGLYISVPAGG